MTNNSKIAPIPSRLDLSPAVRWPVRECVAFDIGIEVIVTDAGPDHRPNLCRAAVLDIHSSLIIARRIGA